MTRTLIASVAAMVISALFGPAASAQTTRPAGNHTVIEIATSRSLLTLCVGSDNRLYQLGYGTAGTRPAVPDKLPVASYDRAADRQTEFYPSAGNGYLSEPALQVIHADGNTSGDLAYVSHKTEPTGDPNVSVTRIELKDPKYPFAVTLAFKAYREQDMLEAWSEIRHDESGPVVLSRFASSSPLLRAKEYWLTQFYGYHMREAAVFEERLTPGTKILDSKLGVRAHQMRVPGFVLSLDGPASEESGQAIGGSLEWSGNFQFAFDLDWNNGLRTVAGINTAGAPYRLEAGKTLITPAMLWTWTDGGKGQVSRNFHRWARKYGLRDGERPRPVLLNNWEATYFKFDEKKLVSLFDGAKELGVEIFLLDDGWFGGKYPRNNDKTSLGDWTVDKKKLPNGLSYLVQEAKKRGIEFGIWLEPEMVSPKSELFEKHPEWALGQPGREPILGRSQRVLDLTRPAVKDFVFDVIDKTLKDAPGTRYVKWDSNAYALQPGSTYLKPEEQTHLLIDYQLNLYDVMRKTAKAHPDVMMMLCSSGPARVDYESLRHFHSFWTSDNTDPAKRVFIQWGFSHLYPAAAMSAHVTDMGKRPLKFAADVALSGAFGIDMDLAKLSAEDRKQLAGSVKLYKNSLREIVSKGDLYRLESPYENPRSAIMYTSEDKSRAVLFVYQVKNLLPSMKVANVRLRGIVAERKYLVREVNLPEGATSRLSIHDQIVEGKTLIDRGILPPCEREFDSAVIELIAQ